MAILKARLFCLSKVGVQKWAALERTSAMARATPRYRGQRRGVLSMSPVERTIAWGRAGGSFFA